MPTHLRFAAADTRRALERTDRQVTLGPAEAGRQLVLPSVIADARKNSPYLPFVEPGVPLRPGLHAALEERS